MSRHVAFDARSTPGRAVRGLVALAAMVVPLSLLAVAPVAAGGTTISVSDAFHAEGEGATLDFTVSLNAASGSTVTVTAATKDGTATAVEDYVALTKPLTFTPGQTTKVVHVSIVPDTKDEVDQTVKLKLSGLTGATIADGTGLGTIDDDDGPGAHVTAGALRIEGGPGQAHQVAFTVALTAKSVQQVQVEVSTTGGTATPGADYTALDHKLVTFAPGELQRTVNVTIKGDFAPETDESVFLRATGGTDAGPFGGDITGWITNDDCTGKDDGLANAFPAGPISGDTSVSYSEITRSAPCNEEAHWYSLQLREDDAGADDITARVRLFVDEDPEQGGGDLDMCVYRKTAFDADTLIGCRSKDGTGDETLFVRRLDTPGVDDSRTIWVRVFHASKGPNGYRLKITGDVDTDVAPNL